MLPLYSCGGLVTGGAPVGRIWYLEGALHALITPGLTSILQVFVFIPGENVQDSNPYFAMMQQRIPDGFHLEAVPLKVIV